MSQDQIIEKPNSHIFSPITFKLAHNDVLDKISDKFKIGSCVVKNRSQDHIIEISLMNTVEATFSAKSTTNLLTMMSLTKFGHVWNWVMWGQKVGH